MAGIDAPAILGVISSVISIIDGTKKVYDAARNAASLPEAFGDVANRLPFAMQILDSSHNQIRNTRLNERSCSAMKLVLNKCQDRAEKLDTIFQKVIPADETSRYDRYLSVARTYGKGGRVETLMQGLLDDLLLLASEKGINAATTEQVNGLTAAIKDLSAIKPSLPDAVFENTPYTNNNFGSGTMTNNHVLGDQTANFGPGSVFRADTQNIRMGGNEQIFHVEIFSPGGLIGVLDELDFDRMDERYDDIGDAHKETFQWIYETPQLGFVPWLESGKGVFWITGKPGSGKSTLMKFVSGDPRTVNNLPKDVENIFITSFFFQDKGSNELLKSQEGLFRTILYKLLGDYRQLIPIALPKRYERWQRMMLSRQPDARTPEWSTKELIDGFKAIVSESEVKLRLCLFIDGLDEISSPYDHLVEILVGLVPRAADTRARVQLCLSSRPLREFEREYSQHKYLKVQDLTVNDIKFYVITQFNKNKQLRSLLDEDPTTTNLIIDEILWKANGVFLWVTLVVKSLSESLENGDNMKTLQRRLSALPAGLVPLYRRMVDQIKSYYHDEASRIFHMVQCAVLPLSSLSMSFAEDNPEDAMFHETVFSDVEIAKRHLDVSNQLKARTAGLIEVNQVGHHDRHRMRRKSQHGSEEKGIPWGQSQVQYMHLTVKEFILNEQIPSWLANKTSKSVAFDTHLRIAACCLHQLRATESLDLYDYHARFDAEASGRSDPTTDGLVLMIMFHARQEEQKNQTSMLGYLESLDNFVKDRNLLPALNNEHWTISLSDWSEPKAWRSDFVSYLITIGMTRSVVHALNKRGYGSKPGRPLLLYATSNTTTYHAFGRLGRPVFDPVIVAELLKLNSNPNQFFGSGWDPQSGLYEPPGRTVWEAALVQILQLSEEGKLPEESHRYNQDVENDEELTDNLCSRCLRTFELFLQYGANPKQTVTRYEYNQEKREPVATDKEDALSIFERIFLHRNTPMILSIHSFMVNARRRGV
ncbi:hypothetical protein E8E14_009169 [Neopestalotiopsis sp. 37M]|nr:hypothetical protein E8E14_009169 [Neopestalotiopsis sp. 37M]